MKKLISLLLVLCMVFAMTACGNSEPAETKAPEEPVAQATEAATEVPTEPELPKDVAIELWTDMTIDEAVLTNAIAAFESEYADYGYTITLNKFAGSQRSALISAAKETNTLPALLLSAWFTTADYAHQGNSSCHILLFVSCLGSILELLFLCTLVKSGGSINT